MPSTGYDSNVAWWRPGLKPGWRGPDPSLRDLQVAMAGLLPSSPGQKFVAQVLRCFSFFWLLLGPNSGPVFGPKNGSSNLAFNRKCILGVKLGPKNGSHFWDLEISFFCCFFCLAGPFPAAGCEHQPRAYSWQEWPSAQVRNKHW